MEGDTAIYHFTDRSEKRPIVYESAIEKIVYFAEGNGWCIGNIYCDKSLKINEHVEFEKFIKDKDNYSRLLVKDYYHVSKNTGACISILNALKNSNIDVISMEDTPLKCIEPPLGEKRNIAIYLHTKTNNGRSTELQLQIFNLFIRTKTKWKLIDTYVDENITTNSDSQKEWDKLIKNKEKYDLVLTSSFNNINGRTSNFCKRRETLQLDIHSLLEGFIQYVK
jgi:DNA invertase Pin-like site-specific DNA recombinase